MSPARNRTDLASAPSSGEARSRGIAAEAVRAAVRLFEAQGFESTSVSDLAAAVGVSRATFFRQVGGKEEAIFADHAPLLEGLEAWMHQRLGEDGADPHAVVCQASLQVFSHLAGDLASARLRYGIVRSVPALRDREIITERRYERLFVEILRAHLPHADPLGTVVFAAAVTAAHNHALRALLRDEQGTRPGATDAAAEALRAALADLRARLTADDLRAGDGRSQAEAEGAAMDAVTVVVATLPSSSASGAGVEAVVEKVRRALE